ncbi:hypothetical protein D3C85_1541960 [compost metagenome]
MLTLLRRPQITAQNGVTALQLVDIGDTLHYLRQMRGRQHAAGPFTVLRMVRELNGIEWPNVGPQAAHGELGSAIAGMTKNNVGLNGEDVIHFSYHNPEKIKGRGFPRPSNTCDYFQQTRQ